MLFEGGLIKIEDKEKGRKRDDEEKMVVIRKTIFPMRENKSKRLHSQYRDQCIARCGKILFSH
jgi:hypothetical protein